MKSLMKTFIELRKRKNYQKNIDKVIKNKNKSTYRIST